MASRAVGAAWLLSGGHFQETNKKVQGRGPPVAFRSGLRLRGFAFELGAAAKAKSYGPRGPSKSQKLGLLAASC